MKGIPFHKAHGAGNDFVILDSRRTAIPPPTRVQIRAMLDRRLGIGGDGLMLLSAAPGGAAVSVRYWNRDGSSAPFCGNGARCAADLVLGRSTGSTGLLVFGRRQYHARRAGSGRIRLGLPSPRLLALPDPPPPGVEALWPSECASQSGAQDGRHERGGESPAAAWIDSGVPHLILPVSDLDGVDLAGLAPRIGSWHAFGRAGTNVDLVEEAAGKWRVRTWERGVEAETPACGSGLAAAGFYAAFLRGRSMPIELRSAGGDRFTLGSDPTAGRIWLEGPACLVFSGRLPHGYPVARGNRGR